MTDIEWIEGRLKRTFQAVAEVPVDAAAPVEPAVGAQAEVTSRARGATVVLRRVAVVAAVGLIAAAAVLIVVYGPRSSRPGRPEVPGTRPPPSSTTPTQGTLAQATIALDSYVAAEQSKEATAGNNSPANVWGTVINEHSAPVRVDNTIIAVTAYSFDPQGHPVQVLSYADGRWALAQALPAPIEQGTIYHADAMNLFSQTTPIAVIDMKGDTAPGFLILLAGGGCSSGAVVTNAAPGESWRYVPFVGPLPTSDVIGGDPQVAGHAIVSDNDCTATITPPSQRFTWTWTYDPASGHFRGVQTAGWPQHPLGVRKGPTGLGAPDGGSQGGLELSSRSGRQTN